MFLALLSMLTIFASCAKSDSSPDLASAVAGTYVGSSFTESGTLVTANYRFTISKVGTLKEVRFTDNSGTPPVNAFIDKTTTTTTGATAHLGFISSGQTALGIPIAQLQRAPGVSDLVKIIPDIGTYSIVYDEKEKTILIGLQAGSTRGLLLAKKQ